MIDWKKPLWTTGDEPHHAVLIDRLPFPCEGNQPMVVRVFTDEGWTVQTYYVDGTYLLNGEKSPWDLQNAAVLELVS